MLEFMNHIRQSYLPEPGIVSFHCTGHSKRARSFHLNTQMHIMTRTTHLTNAVREARIAEVLLTMKQFIEESEQVLNFELIGANNLPVQMAFPRK